VELEARQRLLGELGVDPVVEHRLGGGDPDMRLVELLPERHHPAQAAHQRLALVELEGAEVHQVCHAGLGRRRFADRDAPVGMPHHDDGPLEAGQRGPDCIGVVAAIERLVVGAAGGPKSITLPPRRGR
jgi:hypothetical protein